MSLHGRTDRTKFRRQVLRPLLEAGWLEMTVPDKPTSSKQKYRLTEKGRYILAEMGIAGCEGVTDDFMNQREQPKNQEREEF